VQERRFLERLRALTQEHGALLVFDEVISGFRFGFHGYVKGEIAPDLTTLGKIVGGGLPVGAIVARGEILDRLAPLGKTYQAGTMAGNPVALAAGIATLTELRGGAPYARLDELGRALDAAFAKKPDPHLRLLRVGSLFWPYYELHAAMPTQAERISSDAVAQFKSRYTRWLDLGIYLPPSAYEVGFLSSAHTLEDVERLVVAL
jgi:glutamate-1-semialdehyde 2,1-aminomutase